jgi:hypothetical protein
MKSQNAWGNHKMTESYNKMTAENYKMTDENQKMTNKNHKMIDENKKMTEYHGKWFTQNVKWLSSVVTGSWTCSCAGSGGWSTWGRRDGQCGMKSGARVGTGSEGTHGW